MEASERSAAGFAPVLGTHLYYEVNGVGMPLLLIHSGWLDGRMWDEQFALFAQHCLVIRYDVRGYGRSAMPSVPYSHVADLDALLTFLELDAVVVLGLSMGGMIALDFALQHPERVKAVIAIATPVRGIQPAAEEFEPAAAPVRAAQQGQYAQAINLQLARWFPQQSTKASAQAQQRIRAIMEDFSFPRLAPTAPVEQWPSPITAERLTAIQMPTMIVVGEQDEGFIRRCADVLATQIPRAQLVCVPHAGHLVNIDQPEQFHQTVLRFLTPLR